MADLLIKPLTGAGNTVTIQDQAGGAILTSENSGATLSNATLTSPTLVTPALGTPASGVMTNMTGTPSAINLANATFPAGKKSGFKSTGHTRSRAARLFGPPILITAQLSDWSATYIVSPNLFVILFSAENFEWSDIIKY